MSRVRDFPPLRRIAVVVFSLFVSPFAAQAVDIDAKLEPGAALPLSAPQSDRFSAGGAASFKILIGNDRGYVDVAGGLTFLGLSSQSGFPSSDAGTAWAPSLGIRIQRPRESEIERYATPHAHESFHGARPWLDADILYVRTGGLDRAGFAGAVGLAFPLGKQRSFWLGPFVRYFQILQKNQSGLDERDAKILIIGLSLEMGTRLVRPSPPAPPQEAVVCPEVVAVAAAPAPAPVVIAAPVYEHLVIKPDRLELKEKIQFADNRAEIDPVSHPLLDEVARALQDHNDFRVAIEGHSSSEGPEARNETLSEERAQAVLSYLANKGVARSRLVSHGFSSTRPIESNSTESGREANRRVDFVVHFIILKEESKP